MRKTLFLALLLCSALQAVAQKVFIKDVFTGDSKDLTARREARKDPAGKNCALIRVGIVGVKDMTFPDAIGEVAHIGSEYQVYVPDGLQALRYSSPKSSVSGSIRFADYPKVEGGIQSNLVYRVVFETENHIRAAVFSIAPATAKLTVDGVPTPLDADGMAVVEKPAGSYKYSVSATGYELASGTITLTEEEISTTADIELEPVMHPLSITCVPADAALSIDDVPYGAVNENTDLMVPEGRRRLRLLAVGYDDYERYVDVNANTPALNIVMNQKKQEVVVYKKERTRTHVNIRPGYYLMGYANLFDKKKYDAQLWAIGGEFSFMQHFGGIFAVREGIGYNCSFLSKKHIEDTFEATPKDSTTSNIEIPLQIGISIPFGFGNRHLISVLGGVYGKYMWTEVVDHPDGKSSEEAFDYGLRLTALLEINRFVFGAELSNSLKDRGMYYGLTFGINMGKKKD